jgi:uncharacterized surface protein with fasciclin (FAS1) repeats
MMGNTGMRTVVLALAALGIAGCTTASKKDVVDTIASSGNHNTLVQAIRASGLEPTLREKGPYTVMAPTDEAFALMPKYVVDALMKPENKAQLAVIPGNDSMTTLSQTGMLPQYSKVQNASSPSDMKEACSAGCTSVAPVQSLGGFGGNVQIFNNTIPWKTAAGPDLTVGQWDGSVDGYWVNSYAMVTKADIPATNGVVHSIDRVLLPH